MTSLSAIANLRTFAFLTWQLDAIEEECQLPSVVLPPDEETKEPPEVDMKQTAPKRKAGREPSGGKVDKYYKLPGLGRKLHTRICIVCNITKTSDMWYKAGVDRIQYCCQPCYDILRKERQRACDTCNASKTDRWHPHFDDPTKSLCHACFETAISARVCVSCDATGAETWRKDPNDPKKFHCLPCWQRIFLRGDPNYVCADCETKTSQFWRKRNIKTGCPDYLCGSCFDKMMTKRSCAECHTKDPHERWRKNPIDKVSDLCNKCYARINLTLRKTCSDCKWRSTSATAIWHKHPTDLTKYICDDCFLEKAL